MKDELGTFDSSKKHAVEILLNAAVLSRVVDCDLQTLVTEQTDNEPLPGRERTTSPSSGTSMNLARIPSTRHTTVLPVDRSRTEDTSATDSVTGDARYRYTIEVCNLANAEYYQ